ncbi:MAG: hypothetical protein R3256_07220 [Thalassovita sp.]|nr:hypothetical protein [Thalassovita sp.]
MAGKQVFLHTGAHRTGTSSFQLCLSENRALLETEGFDLAYPGRDGAPQGQLALRLPGLKADKNDAAQLTERARVHLQDLSPQSGRNLVLSEENIPGRMIHFYNGQFYPAAGSRLEALNATLPGEVAHLVHVIRPYHELFVSAFRKRAEDNPVGPFEDISRNMAVFQGGWPEVIGLMRDILRPARLTVIEYGKRGESRALLGHLIGVHADGFTEPDRALNISATDAALFELQRRYHAGERLSRKAWQRVIRDHAGDRVKRGFTHFRAGQVNRLSKRYQRDLEKLSQMEGVTLIA